MSIHELEESNMQIMHSTCAITSNFTPSNEPQKQSSPLHSFRKNPLYIIQYVKLAFNYPTPTPSPKKKQLTHKIHYKNQERTLNCKKKKKIQSFYHNQTPQHQECKFSAKNLHVINKNISTYRGL